MTDGKVTELVFVIDKSGSMSGLEADTVGGFNSMLEKQKDSEGTVLVSTVLFSDRMKYLYERADIRSVPRMDRGDYLASGSTALLDAVGHAIDHVDAVHGGMKEGVPSKTIFVIMTDGYENSSVHYRADTVRGTIENHKRSGWEFIFVGANIDVVQEAANIGIDRDDTIKFCCSREGIKDCFAEMSCSLYDRI